MKKFFLVLLSILIILLSGAGGFFSYLFLYDPYRAFDDYRNDIGTAQSYYESKSYEDSLRKLEDVNKSLAGNSFKYYTKLLEGKNYYQLKKYPQALSSLKEFEKFISIKDHQKKLHNYKELTLENQALLAITYYELEDYKLSESYFAKIQDKTEISKLDLPVQPEELDFLYSQSLVHNEKDKEAISILNDLVSRQGIMKEVKSNSLKLIGDIYSYKLEDNDKAISYYEKAYTLHKDLPVIERLSDVYLELGEFELALSYIQTGLQLFTENENISALLTYEGIAYYKLGDFEESINSLKLSEELILVDEKMKEKEKQTVYTTNRMYLMYDYFQMKDYQGTLSIIEEILNDTQFSEENKEIAMEYKTDVETYMIYGGR